MSYTKLATCLFLIVLCGCGPTADTQIRVVANVANSPRITIERIAVVSDSIAYERKRGVYVIHDTQTGKEYFGISGIGIAEVGSHRAGKVTYEDER